MEGNPTAVRDHILANLEGSLCVPVGNETSVQEQLARFEVPTPRNVPTFEARQEALGWFARNEF